MLDKKITDSFVFRQGEPQYISRISRYGARGILLNAKKQVALMYMRNKGLYKLPGGGIDENETKEEAFTREVKEETGLDIYPIQFVEKFQYVADQGKRLSTQYNFLCLMKNEDQEVKLSKEHSNFKWVYSIGEVELMVNPELKRAIAKAFNYHEQIVNYDMENEVEQKIEESLRRMQ